MHILLVEDASRFSQTLARRLEAQKHTVARAITVSDANGHLGVCPFDCLIVDLNMRTIGLSEDLATQTYNGLCTGWIWLREVAFVKDPLFRRKTIVYSAYLKEFFERMPNENRSGVVFIEKGTSNAEHGERDRSVLKAVASISASISVRASSEAVVTGK